MSERIDVLVVMDQAIARAGGSEHAHLKRARVAVADLIEAVSDVYGDEVNAGRGTCAPDCMSCRIQTALTRVQGGAP